MVLVCCRSNPLHLLNRTYEKRSTFDSSERENVSQQRCRLHNESLKLKQGSAWTCIHYGGSWWGDSMTMVRSSQVQHE